jgi:hypothetical protein
MESKPIRILDVRPKTEFGICHLPSSIRASLTRSAFPHLKTLSVLQMFRSTKSWPTPAILSLQSRKRTWCADSGTTHRSRRMP